MDLNIYTTEFHTMNFKAHLLLTSELVVIELMTIEFVTSELMVIHHIQEVNGWRDGFFR